MTMTKTLLCGLSALALAACTTNGTLPDDTPMPMPPEANGGGAAGTRLAGAAPTSSEVTVAGPEGPLAGTLVETGEGAPAVLILPGSGPTDRNGDNPMGSAGGVYQQIAMGLADAGISSLRADKRGMNGSAKAVADPNDTLVMDYVADAKKWSDLLHGKGHHCVWLAGHSEGGLISLVGAAVIDPCGMILIAAPGRPLGTVLREQLKPKLPAEMYASADAALTKLEAGGTVDPADVPAPLMPLFNPKVQGYLKDMMRYDPAKLAADLDMPLLIINGAEDLQVSTADAKALAAANGDAKLVILDGVNHVLKPVPAGDMAANAKAYLDASIKVDPRVIQAIVDFVNQPR